MSIASVLVKNTSTFGNFRNHERGGLVLKLQSKNIRGKPRLSFFRQSIFEIKAKQLLNFTFKGHSGMNMDMANEVGVIKYIMRRILWRIRSKFAIAMQYRLPHGQSIILPFSNFFASDVYVTGANVDWESERILANYFQSLPEKHDFLDVGAHIGYYSAYVSPFSRKCYAFEPDRRNLQMLRDNAKLLPNLEIIHKAVSNKSGPAFIDTSDGSSISHLSNIGQSIEAISIDDFCHENPDVYPAAIKVDIEGFDILALEGAIETAKKHRPVFVIEFSMNDGVPNSPERLERFMIAANYSLWSQVRDRNTGKDTFTKLKTEDIPHLWVKMLFIVPSEISFIDTAIKDGISLQSKK